MATKPRDAEVTANEAPPVPHSVNLDDATKKDRTIVERYLQTGECPDDVTINLARMPIVQKKGA
ncbi:MAG: hypothetical protein WBA46_04620 [Thermomicrobiales bacterium]